MPRKFYGDTDRTGEVPKERLCLNETTMFDSPAFCMRPKNHKVDKMPFSGPGTPPGEFHQEEHEGWIWDDTGMAS